MSISGAMANANSGLSAASQRASVVSNNVANALTPGYARREISVSEQILAGSGAGVRVDGVVRAADPAITRERRFADGAVGRDQAIAAAYGSLNAALGEPDDPFSLFGQYQNFETALRTLGESPESGPAQAQVLDAAKALTTTFNQLAGEASRARQDADNAIARDVAFVNDALKQIEKLNADIAKAATGGRDGAALEDQRKILIDQISAIVPVREIPRGGGAVDLVTSEGIFLLSGSAKKIEFTPTSNVHPGLTLAEGELSGLTVDGVDVTPGGSTGMALKQGSLAGQFAIRDEIIPEFQAQIDALARDVMERFEGVDATLAPGAPGLFTDEGAAFDAAAELGLSGRLAINAAVDPDQGGALWRFRDGLGAGAEGPVGNATFIRSMLDSLTASRTPATGAGLSGSLSAAQMAAGVSSLVGTARISSESNLSSAQARASAVSDAELAVTGVDTDLEMQKLILIEQAFAANARVIQTAQEMVKVLMEI